MSYKNVAQCLKYSTWNVSLKEMCCSLSRVALVLRYIHEVYISKVKAGLMVFRIQELAGIEDE